MLLPPAATPLACPVRQNRCLPPLLSLLLQHIDVCVFVTFDQVRRGLLMAVHESSNNNSRSRSREHAAQGSESAGRIAWADNIWIKMPPVSQTHALGGSGGGCGGVDGAGLTCHAPTPRPHMQLKWLIGWSDLKPRHDELTFVGCLRL